MRNPWSPSLARAGALAAAFLLGGCGAEPPATKKTIEPAKTESPAAQSVQATWIVYTLAG